MIDEGGEEVRDRRMRRLLARCVEISFVHLLDAMADADRTFQLPARSRVLDTGGFKGKSLWTRRSPSRGWRALGLPDLCPEECGRSTAC
jgi:hypothetical protein